MPDPLIVCGSPLPFILLGSLLFTTGSAGAQSGAWTQLATTGPVFAGGQTLVADILRGRLVHVGANSANPGPQLETWEWDGVCWSQVPTPGGPPARTRHALACDWGRGQIVLFGGDDGTALCGDTWEWDGANWQLRAITGPSPRRSAAMAHDPIHGRTVLFGGMAATGFSDDTFEWDGTSWNLMTPVTRPAARQKHAMAFENTTARVVLYGGVDFDLGGQHGGSVGCCIPRTDTWEWDGLDWVLRDPVGPVEPTPSLAMDMWRGRLFLLGDQGTFEWRHSAWSMITGPVNGLPWGPHGIAYDLQRSRVMAVGGELGTYSPVVTWELTPTSAAAAVYGLGCGAPALDLQPAPGGAPHLGAIGQVDLSHVPGSIGILSLGWSNVHFGAQPLPMSLAPFGLTGCELLQSSAVPCLAMAPSGNGTARFSIGVPGLPALVGLHVYLQAWAPVQGANPAGVIVSNGVDWWIGL